MGSYIYLGLEGLEIDWGKNQTFTNHSALFLSGDTKDIIYYYADNETQTKRGYARSLRSVVRRLELLGYSLSRCRSEYEDLTKQCLSHGMPALASFREFARTLKNINVREMPIFEEYDECREGELARSILSHAECSKTKAFQSNTMRWDYEFFENIHPYIILRLLAENQQNLDLEVQWRFSDVVEGGWADEDKLYEGLSDKDRYLIVTEGSSDMAILKKSLPLVAPDIADFFDFIDMSDNYPFTGTGNVVRFTQGLAKIKIQNRVLVVLDNDTAGHSAMASLSGMKLPKNIKVTVLPNLKDCQKVRTIGPSGKKRENINGRAVSIEWFLDLNFESENEPMVRWTSYDSNQDKYQGELIEKDQYARLFLKKVDGRKKYDFSKLAFLWQSLLNCAVSP